MEEKKISPEKKKKRTERKGKRNFPFFLFVILFVLAAGVWGGLVLKHRYEQKNVQRARDNLHKQNLKALEKAAEQAIDRMKEEAAAGNEIVHFLHIDRVDEVDAVMTAKDGEGALAHDRAEVHGVDELAVLILEGDVAQRGHDVLHGLAVILAAVARHEHDLS